MMTEECGVGESGFLGSFKCCFLPFFSSVSLSPPAVAKRHALSLSLPPESSDPWAELLLTWAPPAGLRRADARHEAAAAAGASVRLSVHTATETRSRCKEQPALCMCAADAAGAPAAGSSIRYAHSCLAPRCGPNHGHAEVHLDADQNMAMPRLAV